jgi:hypothetical protein
MQASEKLAHKPTSRRASFNPPRATQHGRSWIIVVAKRALKRNEALLTTDRVIVYEVVTNMRQVLADRSERYHPVRTGHPIRHARRFI